MSDNATKPRVREIFIKDKTVLVDEDLWPFLKRFKWYITGGYAVTTATLSGKPRTISMHRLIMGMSRLSVDHIDRNRLNNTVSNLRLVSVQQNAFNQTKVNKIGYRGVYQSNRQKTFGAQLEVNGKSYRSSGHKTAEEAARAYDELSKEHHGEHGVRNFNE